MKANFFLLASFAGLPLLSAAQTTPASSKFYVGVGTSVLTDIVFRPSAYSPTPALVGPSLTLGWQFTPRLGAQVGASYAWRTIGTGDPTFYSVYQVRYRVFTAPLLLRYSFRPTTSRFHVDAFGGVTLQRSVVSYDYRFAFSGTPYPDGIAGQSTSTRANLTLGPAVRYSLTPQLELAATPLVNMSLGENYSTFRTRLFWNALVGVNYTFGQ